MMQNKNSGLSNSFTPIYTGWSKSPSPRAPDTNLVTFGQIEIQTWNFLIGPRLNETTFRIPQSFWSRNPRGYMGGVGILDHPVLR